MEEVKSEVAPEDAAELGDVLGNASRLVKFVRAREKDAKKVVKMLHNTAKFRRAHNYSDLMTRFKPNEDFKTVLLFPIHYLRDKDGSLVLVHRTGHFNGSYFCKYYSEDYLLELVAYCLNILTMDAQEHLDKTGAPPYITFLLDLEGYGGHVLGPMGITQKLIGVFQNHFPETLKQAVVINTPWIFRAVWKIVSAFLDPVVKKKIKIVGSGGEKAVREIMNEDQIPGWLGGEYKHNGDDYSSEVIAQGGRPPKPVLAKKQKYIDQPPPAA